MEKKSDKREPVRKTAPASDIDEYIATAPKDSRALLGELRRAIRAVLPDAVEVISYGIPTFKYLGPVVGFGAFKHHCSLFVDSGMFLGRHRDEVKGYEQAKSAVHFPIDKPLPTALVKRLVKARMRENEERDREREKGALLKQRISS